MVVSNGAWGRHTGMLSLLLVWSDSTSCETTVVVRPGFCYEPVLHLAF